MSYGLVAITHPPEKLEKQFQSVWYKCLPSLKVNRCLRKEWRSLPLRFQGLAMPEVNIELLGRKIHLVQHHWGCRDVAGKFLTHAYEALQVKTGIGGNIFDKDFKVYECLATHGWFKGFA